MSSTLTASSVKPGVRRSKSYTSGRICDFSGCETVISIYNKKKLCFTFPVSYQEFVDIYQENNNFKFLLENINGKSSRY